MTNGDMMALLRSPSESLLSFAPPAVDLSTQRLAGGVFMPVKLTDKETARLLRLWRHVDKTPTCWLWNGPASKRGYAKLSKKLAGQSLVHRLLWSLRNGPIPDGMVVHHICRVRNCINPKHLECTTNLQNILAGEQGAYYFQNELFGWFGDGRTVWPACPWPEGRVI